MASICCSLGDMTFCVQNSHYDKALDQLLALNGVVRGPQVSGSDVSQNQQQSPLACLRSIVNSVGNNGSETKVGKHLKVKAQIHTPTEDSGISDPNGHKRDAVRAIPPPTAFADDITTHGIKRKEPGSGSVVHSSEESDEICVIPNTPEQKRQRQSWESSPENGVPSVDNADNWDDEMLHAWTISDFSEALPIESQTVKSGSENVAHVSCSEPDSDSDALPSNQEAFKNGGQSCVCQSKDVMWGQYLAFREENELLHQKTRAENEILRQQVKSLKSSVELLVKNQNIASDHR
ncbi:uncharacterized protein [Chanodichthys erythropterus]|uniref:uncharacterized protein isoform X1 n=1 Tax=Chanodichthys erythropterus TaxID=933992 RepID=UPI00351EB574